MTQKEKVLTILRAKGDCQPDIQCDDCPLVKTVCSTLANRYQAAVRFAYENNYDQTEIFDAVI